jgi:hypothetical protein
MLMLTSVLSAIWGNQIGRTVLIGTGLFVFGVFKGWGWAADGRDAAIQHAISTRDAYWQETINKANTEHDTALQNAIAAANAIVPASTNDDLKRLCADTTGGADCRDQKSNRVQGVQPSNMERRR